MRGKSIPLEVLLTSSMEEACGDELSVVMLTWPMVFTLKNTRISSGVKYFFMSCIRGLSTGKIIGAGNGLPP